MDRTPHGIAVVRSGRNPHTISLAIGLALVSVYGLITSVPSVSLGATLSYGQRVGFCLLALFGAGLILRGLFHRRLRRALQIEQIGQASLAIGAGFYVGVLLAGSGFGRSGIVITIAGSVAVGSAWRAWQIARHELPIAREGEQRG